LGALTRRYEFGGCTAHDLDRLLGSLAFKVGFEGIELFLKRQPMLRYGLACSTIPA
jgi:hypothetical protein